MPLFLLDACSSYLQDQFGVPYQFQLHPEVQSVQPEIGSLAGGTMLTIAGRGFPDLDFVDLGLPDAAAKQGSSTISILVAGVPCRVVSSSYLEMKCVTGAAPGGAMPVQKAISGTYPGYRGIYYDFMPVA